MSHPLYNPYASGNQRATQGQYGLSGGPAEKDIRTVSSRLGPGSSFSSSGTSSVISANSGGITPPLLPQSMSYRPEKNGAIIDKNMEIDMHISRAREELRLLGKPMQQSIDSCFTGTQSELLSSGSGMVSYPTSSTSASLGQRYPGVESGSSSLDWSSNYKRPTADEPSTFYSSSASSNYASGVDGRFNASSDRERDMPSNQQKYTSESASNILVHFGLEKDDLEHLISYPENQITLANMPFILQQIRLEKIKRATTAAQSKPHTEPQSSRMSHSGGAGMCQEEISPAVRQLSNVIDYGHTGKYTGEAGEEIGRTSGGRDNSGGSGSMLPMDTYSSSRHGREPMPKTEVKSSALGFSRMQQTQQQPVQMQPVQQTQQQPMQQQPKQPVSQAMWPPFFPAAKSVLPASHMPSITDAMQRPVFIPGGPPPIVSPPPLPQPIPDLMGFIHGTMPPSNRQPPAKAAASKDLPTAAMMHDYAAASPRIFPHTCCLCSRECLQMEDWISHQNTSCHLKSCKVLRKQYPEWDAEIALSAAGEDASSSASSQTSQHRQEARHGSRSSSPRRYHRSEGRQERQSRRSQSRSPYSSRYTRRSRSRSPSPRYDRPTSSRYWPRSRSPERQSPPRRRDDRRSSPKRSRERRSSPRWNRERRSSSRRSDERRSPSRRSNERRSPSRMSVERRSPSRRSDERRSPSRRSNERRSPSRRSVERRSPSSRSDERRSLSRRSDERRSPSRRSDERWSPTRRSNERRSPKRKSSNTDNLVKKLLETSAVQSLSKQLDLETVVKTLAPVLIAELFKMKSTSSSSSTSVGGKPSSSSVSSSTKKPSKATPRLQKSETDESSLPTEEETGAEKKKNDPKQSRPVITGGVHLVSTGPTEASAKAETADSEKPTSPPKPEPMEQAPEKPTPAETPPVAPGQHQQVEDTEPASAGPLPVFIPAQLMKPLKVPSFQFFGDYKGRINMNLLSKPLTWPKMMYMQPGRETRKCVERGWSRETYNEMRSCSTLSHLNMLDGFLRPMPPWRPGKLALRLKMWDHICGLSWCEMLVFSEEGRRLETMFLVEPKLHGPQTDWWR